jgi:hypothetical protein
VWVGWDGMWMPFVGHYWNHYSMVRNGRLLIALPS